MKRLCTGLACAALGCGPEGPVDLAEPVGSVAQSLSLEPQPLAQSVIASLDRLDAAPNPRWTSGGTFTVNPRFGCHHVQSAAKYNGHYLLSHSMPDQAQLAVVDPAGEVHQVPLWSAAGGRTLVHPGGIQVMGEVLAVALADDNCLPPPAEPEEGDAVVRFYHISNPLTPASIPGTLPDLTLDKAQAVALTRLGTSTVVAVLTGTRSLRFFQLVDGTMNWVDKGQWVAAVEADDAYDPPEDQKYCTRSDLQWCRPDTINLYREVTNGVERLQLLTFSRGTKDDAGDRERIGVYSVTGLGQGQTPAVARVKTYELLPSGSQGNFRYGGGSEVTNDGALMAFAFPSQLDDGGDTAFARYGGWSKAAEYDSGREATVALNDSGVAVQVHKGTTGDKLYYRVGQVNQVTRQVAWGGSVSWGNGAKPSVAVDALGNVVVLHTVYNEVTPDIYSCVGRANVTTRSIDWYGCEVTDTGTNPTLAMNKDGGVVEVHNGSRDDNRTKLYARVGRLDVASHRVIFGASQSFDTGADSSVTVNQAGTVVEAHNGTTPATEHNLYFTVGRADFNAKTLSWGSSSKHGTGSHLTIGLNDTNQLVELHHDSTTQDKIYFSVGIPNASNKTLTWKTGVGGRRDTGTGAALAIASAGLLLETHNAPSANSATALWYSVADTLRLP